jgi:uncharacterized protein YecT (DUF1311 family)
MNKRLLIGLILSGAFLVLLPPAPWARDTPRSRCELVPDAWTPSLDQVGDYLDESSKTETQASQQPLNQMGQNLADVRDAQLFITYIQLMQTLDARGQTQLLKEQKRWLGKRDELARAAVVSKGGTLAPLEYSGAFRKITEERLAELQKRLRQGTSTIQKNKERVKP